MRRVLPLVGLLMLLTGCQTAERQGANEETPPTASAVGAEGLVNASGVRDPGVVGFVSGTVTVAIPSKQPVPTTIGTPSPTVFQLVESDLGFAEIQGHVGLNGRNTLVELVVDTKSGFVGIDLVIQIPHGVQYTLRSNHGDIPNFGGLTLVRVPDDAADAAVAAVAADAANVINATCGRLKPGRYRISGTYKGGSANCTQFVWELELHRRFGVPPRPMQVP